MDKIDKTVFWLKIRVVNQLFIYEKRINSWNKNEYQKRFGQKKFIPTTRFLLRARFLMTGNDSMTEAVLEGWWTEGR